MNIKKKRYYKSKQNNGQNAKYGKKTARKIGKYQVIEELGKGGNGVVYQVRIGKLSYAMKTLKDFSKSFRYARFRDEVKALNDLGPIDNVVSLIDYNLPIEPETNDVPYYTMPIGVPYLKHIQGKDHELLFKDFLKIVKAVATLHDKEYTHRDIKPDNLLWIDGKPTLSDFGLVSFPDKSAKSPQNEKIGPQWTIAPEMQRTSSTAEFKKADVYSLAKTLWILITGSKFGFEGQYIPNSNISIDNYVEVMINKPTVAGQWYYHSTVILDKLLSEATDNDPTKRPTAEEFYKILEFWLQTNAKFEQRNPYEWEEAIDTIFPYGMPTTCEWTNKEQIFSVLKRLVAYDNLNYFFYPDTGGDMMGTLELAPDQQTFIINGNRLILPEKLIFRSDSVKRISYFRLVVQNIGAVTNVPQGSTHEEYLADEQYQYVAPLYQEGVNGRRVRKYLNGTFVFVNKRSRINDLRGPYRHGLYMDGHTGIHDQIPAEEYHQMLCDNC
ncbi:serine/threonine protein kinase [Pedobacter paludis]|uniref:Protein kinase domain-containing protein n=1 Tax=Pedobacter paludis TaxID=2203212 RepID=A0A317F3E3_9SPHI|nr:protein kinase [Pedobacter paludis]PWS33355.1 hypothetical protein DF947_01640 [Pedobacter paludis]